MGNHKIQGIKSPWDNIMQDSDSIYTTNQPQIVAHAKKCVVDYPTIVNNIPKEKNVYTSSMKDFAKVDNNLAHSQRAIGESSNLAQLCLSYGHTFDDPKYKDYAAILAVIAQAAIDNAKRSFDIDIPKEIQRVRSEINVDTNGFPAFWLIIRKNFNRSRINWDITCPMNYIYNMQFKSYNPDTVNIPVEEFINHYDPIELKDRLSQRIKDLICKYSLDLFNARLETKSGYTELMDEMESEILFLLKSDFEDLVREIREIGLGNKYLPLMSWLIDQAFGISCPKKGSNLQKNRSLLLKILYEVNPKCLLQIFSKHKCTGQN